MPVRRNPAYQDPHLAKAAENIASMFAPDANIGAQSLNFQKAAQQKWQTERISELYNDVARPGVDMGVVDRRSVLMNLYDPSNSYHAVDTTAATARRGQDITSSDNRYGYDTTARTSESNNVRDNERQIATNANTVRGSTLVGLYGKPLSPGEVGQAVPGEAMATVGLPGVAQREGRERPLSQDEVLAAAMRGADENMLRNRAFAGVGLAPVLNAEGRTVLESNAGAIGREQPPDAARETPDTEVTKLITERDRLPPGSPNRKAYDDRIAALGRGQKQSKYDEETDEALAKQNAKIVTNADGARAQLGSLSYMRQLLTNPATQQGFGADTALELKRAMEAIGIPVGNTSDAEVARALSNKLALYARQEGGENLMPGALSDSDRPFLQRQVAGLGNTRDANMALLGYYERVQQRAIDVEKQRQAYVQKHGRLDEGFRRELSAWTEINPLFPEARGPGGSSGPPGGTPTPPVGGAAPAAPPATAAGPPSAPRAGDVVDGYRFIGGNPGDPASWARAQ